MPSQNKQLNIYPNEELLEWIDSLPGSSRNSKVIGILLFAKAAVKSVPGLQEAFDLLLKPSTSQLDISSAASEPKAGISPATSSLLSSIFEETTSPEFAARILGPDIQRRLSELTTSNELCSESLPTGNAADPPPLTAGGNLPDQQEDRLSKLEQEVQALKAQIDVLSKEVRSRKRG